MRIWVVLCEHSTDHRIHRSWPTMNIHGVWVIKWAYLFENILCCKTFKTCPILRWEIENIMNFKSWLHCLNLFSQNNILLGFIGKQQDHLHILIRHLHNFNDSLIDWCDSTSSSNKKYSFLFQLLPINHNNSSRFIAKSPERALNIDNISNLQFL